MTYFKYRIISRDNEITGNTTFVVQVEEFGQWNAIPGIMPQLPNTRWRDLAKYNTLEEARDYRSYLEHGLVKGERVIDS